ncbi:UDP-glucosyltransferase 2-like isoform X1 [Danaus plexippus]|uniref:UDP-glucosyltransferase 2-like isoform X1 n=2 Tax=Danaus plexippus TaxID=13037 RepID=UPI002AB2CA6B|nr:UDP-glucosyltransferase 2-like isoform X1 [Danaus plexippus]
MFSIFNTMKLQIIFSLVFLASFTQALRLLVFFPMMSKSHSILGQGMVSRLLEAGHEVVHVTAFPRDKPQANLTEINLIEASNRMKEQFQGDDTFKLKNLIGKENVGDSVFFVYMTYEISKNIIEDQTFIKFLLNPNEKFDAVIIEWFFSDIFAGIAPLFKCPLIWFGSTEAHWQILQVVDEIPNPSYSVDIFSVSKPPLNFMERLRELYRIAKKYIFISLLSTPFERSLYNSVFSDIANKRGVTLPSYDEVIYNASLLLINSHPSIGTPFRLPQNAKYIAGYHIDREVKPLPKDLQKLMDEAKHGVIYFSMGSNLKSEDMSESMKKSLLAMFSKLKQTVIWKFESDLDKVPANVHLVKWAPQQSILAHPNLKFFMTHGGQLSTTEAIHFAVPVIGIPVAADQHVNMRSVANKGFGIYIKITEDITDDLYPAIQEMLQNPSYKSKAKELSFIYHNRPLTPGDELVFWTEHVVHTRGALHLRSPALQLPFYQKFFLDLLILILVAIVLCVLVIRFIRNGSKGTKKTKKVKTK